MRHYPPSLGYRREATSDITHREVSNVHRYFPPVRAGRGRSKVATALLASLLVAVFLSSAPSSADNDHSDLHHRKNHLDREVKHQQADVDEVSTQLIRAQARVDAAVTDLRSARAVLSDLRVQVAAAVEVDRQMQERLDQALVRLHDARADLAAGGQAVIDQRDQLAGFALSSYQTGGLGPLSLGLGFDASTVQSVVDGMQGMEAVGNKQSVSLQQLQAAEVLLTLTEERVETTKDDVQQKRAEAAENLETTRELETQAEVAKSEVATKVSSLRVEQQRAAAAKHHEIARLQKLKKERDRVEDRLRKIAERRARQHHSSVSATPSGGGGYLSYPVNNTYITSPYGMRMHPILHVWKLHDGTDFHADCGTPVYAAADGRIVSEYYNVGYGNRIILDHGYVKGVSLWTSYNHLTSFVARVGEHVKRGELIAYSGTTGYSTACHLHFMVYVNGSTVNPVSWL
jgi:murein DD-endopeptidase MepM/ murein hydrolase activator NlpD